MYESTLLKMASFRYGSNRPAESGLAAASPPAKAHTASTTVVPRGRRIGQSIKGTRPARLGRLRPTGYSMTRWGPQPPLLHLAPAPQSASSTQPRDSVQKGRWLF